VKVLHIASFRGNVGDNANHNGMRQVVAEAAGQAVEWHEVEMRRFYVKYDGADRLRWDSEFARVCNTYDLVVVGGGNFFEVWIEGSSTGCTVDIPQEIIAQLKTRVLFYGLGFDTYKGASPQTLAKFLAFMEALGDRKRFLVTVRNDGSWKQFVSAYGLEAARRWITPVVDGGFFVSINPAELPVDRTSGFRVVLSLAMDMPQVRYGQTDGVLARQRLVTSFRRFCTRVLEEIPEAGITLMPHIYSDVAILAELLEVLPDHLRRNRVAVGPCLSGTGTEGQTFASYRDADFVVGMRFHANVCAIAQGVPAVGVATYQKITDLFEELGLSDRVVDGRQEDFSDDLWQQLQDVRTSTRYGEKMTEVRGRLGSERRRMVSLFSEFLEGRLE